MHIPGVFVLLILVTGAVWLLAVPLVLLGKLPVSGPLVPLVIHVVIALLCGLGPRAFVRAIPLDMDGVPPPAQSLYLNAATTVLGLVAAVLYGVLLAVPLDPYPQDMGDFAGHLKVSAPGLMEPGGLLFEATRGEVRRSLWGLGILIVFSLIAAGVARMWWLNARPVPVASVLLYLSAAFAFWLYLYVAYVWEWGEGILIFLPWWLALLPLLLLLGGLLSGSGGLSRIVRMIMAVVTTVIRFLVLIISRAARNVWIAILGIVTAARNAVCQFLYGRDCIPRDRPAEEGKEEMTDEEERKKRRFPWWLLLLLLLPLAGWLAYEFWPWGGGEEAPTEQTEDTQPEPSAPETAGADLVPVPSPDGEDEAPLDDPGDETFDEPFDEAADEPGDEAVDEPAVAAVDCEAAEFRVYFDFDKAELSTEALEEISQAAGRYTEAQGCGGGTSVEVIVEGHADRSGREAHNEGLARRRAEAVRDALIRQGVDPDAITVESYGERQPAVPTPDGQREPLNRRAVIIIRLPGPNS